MSQVHEVNLTTFVSFVIENKITIEKCALYAFHKFIIRLVTSTFVILFIWSTDSDVSSPGQIEPGRENGRIQMVDT